MDAVFVANDQMALSVLRVAHKRGISIPDDLGIVGFDNIPESEFFYPSLTTIHQNQFTVARTAMQELVRMTEKSWPSESSAGPTSITISPSLIVRESSMRKQ